MFRQFFTFVILFISGAVSADSNLELMIKNYNLIYPPAKADIPSADKIIALQKTDGSFKNLDYNGKTLGSWDGSIHWDNLDILASAWHATKDTKYRNSILKGMKFWAEKMPENPNWYWQCIGIPYRMIRIINNMYEEIPQQLIKDLEPCFARSSFYNIRGIRFTGYNLFCVSYIEMWRGLYYNSPERIQNGIKNISSVMELAPRGIEGLQIDYSYHMHGPQQQFGTYGKADLHNVVYFLALLNGTNYKLPSYKAEIFRQFFLEGIRWTLYKKQMDILACGRKMNNDIPHIHYDAVLKTTQHFADEKNIRKQVKDFFEADHLLSGNRAFFCSDHMIQRRENFFFSYRMSSKRVDGTETINSENLQGKHLGNGTMQYKISGDEYEYMPVLWDWRRLPGSTAVYDNGPLDYQLKDNNRSSAVGIVSDNQNGGCMLNLDTTDLNYNKTVAAFGKNIVFNISDINNKTKFPVNTTVDSKRYTAPVTVSFADGRSITYSDGIRKLSDVSKITCGETAYTFPKPAELTLAIEDKEAKWNTITIWAKGSFRSKIVTIYLNGTDPASYIISPASASVKDIKSIIKSNLYHAVIDPKSNIKYIFFFTPCEADIPGIGKVSCDKKASVMITDKSVFLSETEQKAEPVKFTLNSKDYNFASTGEWYAGKTSELPL